MIILDDPIIIIYNETLQKIIQLHQVKVLSSFLSVVHIPPFLVLANLKVLCIFKNVQCYWFQNYLLLEKRIGQGTGDIFLLIST